jgi:hypothetical protein
VRADLPVIAHPLPTGWTGRFLLDILQQRFLLQRAFVGFSQGLTGAEKQIDQQPGTVRTATRVATNKRANPSRERARMSRNAQITIASQKAASTTPRIQQPPAARLPV